MGVRPQAGAIDCTGRCLRARRERRRMRPLSPPAALLEIALLRKSVGSQAAQRDRCVHCARTPLVGERVHRYAGKAGERLVCDLCRDLRKERPVRTELMLSPEHDRAVRVLARAA